MSGIEFEQPTDRVSQACDLCGQILEGNRAGAGSLAWKLAVHKRNKHGIAAKAKARKGKRAPTDDEYEAQPVLSSVRDVASAVTGTGVPNTDQLAAALGRGLSLSNFAWSAFRVESDRGIPPAIRQPLIEHLTITEPDAAAVTRPIAKLMAGTRFNQKYGRAVVENVDMIGALAGIAQIVYHNVEYERDRSARIRAMRAHQAQQGAAGVGPATFTPPMSPAAPAAPVVPDAEGGFTHTQGGMNGVVIGPEDVARMQAQRGSN
jgi:hypothetical protein